MTLLIETLGTFVGIDKPDKEYVWQVFINSS